MTGLCINMTGSTDNLNAKNIISKHGECIFLIGIEEYFFIVSLLCFYSTNMIGINFFQ